MPNFWNALPSALKLHLAFDKGPATRLTLQTLDLGDLLTNGWNRK